MLSEKDLLGMYENMLLIRASESKMVELHKKGEIQGHMTPCLGQEAIPTAIAKILTDNDFIVTGHRGDGHYISKGCDFNALWAELYGKVTGICKGRAGHMHLADMSKKALTGNAVVAAQWVIAAGAGFAAKKGGYMGVVVGGDASTNRGTFHESLNMAAVKKLPILYVVEHNNKMMWSTPEVYMSCKRIASRAKAYDIPGETVDGNDPIAVYKAAAKFAEHIRAGNGPCLLECLTAKWTDSVSNVRDTAEHVAEIKNPDFEPIARFEKTLRDKGLLDNALDAEIKQKVADKMAAALKFAQESPKPDRFDGVDEVYSQPV